jgi:transcription elongation factor GreB
VPKVKNYITVEGAEKLKLELKQLLTRDRPELTRVIEWAASNGDRSENGDYIYGKRRLREMDRRIRFLTKRLEAAEVVDLTKVPRDRVVFGATVTILDEEGLEKTYRIVGQDEIDAKKGNVSWVSPIAKALLNSRVGDVVRLHSPKGIEELEILKIAY